MKKNLFTLVLVALLVVSLPATAYAFGIKLPDFGKAIDKTKDWTENAVDDAKDWTEGAVDDATDWTEGAVDDATKWTEGAVDDTSKWTKGAIKDVAKTMDKVLKDNPDLKEIDLLPVLTVDLSNAANVQTASTGSFKYGNNVKDKKLPPKAAEELKKTLKGFGLTEYWANFVIHEASEASGDVNPGGYVASLLPFSEVLYGDKVADAINKTLKNTTLNNIDPYVDGIIPGDDVDSMDFIYTVDASKAGLAGNNLVIITGLKYGLRDDFTVTVKSGGQEFPAVKKALNGTEVAFVAEVPNVKDLEVVYKNSFEKPADIAFEVADGIQDALNDLSPFGSPISNAARDEIAKTINNLAFYMEETKTDKDGNAKTNKDGSEKKEIEEVSLNAILGDGDVGTILTQAIYKIPALGQIIKPVLIVSGGDDKLAEIIRTAVGQAEVKSYAKLKDGKVYIKKFDSTEEMNQAVANSTTEAKVNLSAFVDDSGNVVEDDGATYIGDMSGDKKPEPVMPTTVNIELGDTVGNISLNYYGDYSMIKAINEANKDYFAKTKDRLNVGDTLVLPTPAKFTPPVVNDNTKVYTVKAGDTLGIISEQFYGTPSKYTKIAEANPGTITNPYKVYEGQKLAIPVE